MDNLEKLIEKRNLLQRKISNLEEKKLTEESIPALKKIIGKCYKFINSYGSNSESWPLYVKITGINEKTMAFYTCQFQHTSLNIIEIKHEQRSNFYGENSFEKNYLEISKLEFNRAKKSLSKTINRLLN